MFERPPQAVARDLDDVRVVEIPWLLTPERRRIRRHCRGANSTARRSRAFTRSASMRSASPRRSRTARRSASSSTAPPATCRSRPGRQFVREGQARRLSQRRARPARIRALIVGRASRPARRSARGRLPDAPGPDDRRPQLPHALRRDRPDRAATARTLVFVEVRLRSSPRFGGAAESITAAKRARLVAAARGYLGRIARRAACRFDAILMQRLDAARIDWRRDVVDRRMTARCIGLLQFGRNDRSRRAHPRPFRRQRAAQARRGRRDGAADRARRRADDRLPVRRRQDPGVRQRRLGRPTRSTSPPSWSAASSASARSCRRSRLPPTRRC